MNEIEMPTVVCAWCDRVLERRGKSLSHGICLACANIWKAELNGRRPNYQN